MIIIAVQMSVIPAPAFSVATQYPPMFCKVKHWGVSRNYVSRLTGFPIGSGMTTVAISNLKMTSSSKYAVQIGHVCMIIINKLNCIVV